MLEQQQTNLESLGKQTRKTPQPQWQKASKE